LREILTLNGEANVEEEREHPGLTYREPESFRTEAAAKKRELLFKLQKERRKRQVKDSKARLPEFVEAPDTLVNFRILHLAEEEDGHTQWFPARVIGVYAANLAKPMQTEYSIVYDIDNEGDSWNFPLLQDLKKGDLILL
jgi:hypothetical protein